MALDFLPGQPPDRTRPTLAQTQAALLALPDGFGAIGARLLREAGLTTDALLIVADALDDGAAERAETLGTWDMEVRALRSLATILRDAAPRYAEQPPRLPPLTALEADASIRHRAWAAGLSTACLRACDRVIRATSDWDLRGESIIGGEP